MPPSVVIRPASHACAGNQVASRQTIRVLAESMYRETFERLENPRWCEVVQKVTLLYGPPMVRPDVFLVSFQGGGGDTSPSRRTWPPRLLYLDDSHKFGQVLRKNFREAGLYEMLEKRTVAMASCFPEALRDEASKWTRKTGPRAEWRRFSSSWVRRMIDAMRPRAVVVFGQKASDALGLNNQWRDAKDQPRRGMVFGHAEVEGCPAVYCHHLSQGWKKEEVQACLAEVKRIADADKAHGLA